MDERNSQYVGVQSSMSRVSDDLLAAEILAVVGPGTILHVGSGRLGLLGALSGLGSNLHDGDAARDLFERGDPSGALVSPRRDTLLLDYEIVARSSQLQPMFHALRRHVGHNLIVLPPCSDARAATEPAPDAGSISAAAMASGYRRHPAAFAVTDFEHADSGRFDRPLYLAIIPDPVLEQWPLERLRAERDLHMDMTREGGPRADAHLVRYSLAAEWVRPGDAVLDCACGLGYGSAVLAARSPGGLFLGVDIDPVSVAYAKDNFDGWGVNYFAASATRLDPIADHSIDTLVSFETLEHLEDYSTFLEEAARILRPGGRIIVSVPNLWMDESGRDPNPHHHHVFDYAKCRDALAAHFRIEARYTQSAPGGTVLQDAPRRLREQPVSSPASQAETEWWIVVASLATVLAEDQRRTPSQEVARLLDTGTRALASGNESAARAAYRQGVELAESALLRLLETRQANPAIATLAEIDDIGSLAHRCALAESLVADYRRAPGLFWRRINARHAESAVRSRIAADNAFEVEARTKKVADLRVELQRMREASTLRTLLPLRFKEVFLIILPRAVARLFGRSP